MLKGYVVWGEGENKRNGITNKTERLFHSHWAQIATKPRKGLLKK